MGATRLLARPDARGALEGWLATHSTLAAAAAAHPAAEPLRGRGRVHVVPAPPGPWREGTRWVVRHYHRGGAVAALLGDRYLRGPVARPAREYEVSRRLGELGIPTAPAIGAAVYIGLLFYRGDLVTEWVAGSRDLAAILFGAAQLDDAGGTADPRDAGTAMEAAGRLVRQLHEGRVIHPDLNIKNILIAPTTSGPIGVVLDLDRARLQRRALSDRARRRMVDRFKRSLRKWEGRAGSAPLAEWVEAFDRGYAAPPR